MKTRIMVVFAAVILAPIFVTAQNQPSGEQKGQDAQQSNPSAPISVDCNCATQTEGGKNNPQGWHKLVTWPEGIATWALMFTLGAIIWQSCETRRAAGAANKSIHLQTLVDAGIWNEKGRIFVVTGTVTYLDCMEIRRTQT